MALTIECNDSKFNLSTGVNLAYASSTNSTQPNFRVKLEVVYTTMDSDATTRTTNTVSFTQQLNQRSTAIFNLSEIYKSILTPQITSANDGEDKIKQSIHNLPTDDGTNNYMYSWGILKDSIGSEAFQGVANRMQLKFYEMYSATATGIPIVQNASLVTKDMNVMWGRGEEQEGVIVDFEGYKLTGAGKQLLTSNYKTPNNKIDIGIKEYHTMAMLNRCDINASAFPYKILVFFYDLNNNLLNSLSIRNQASSGGAYYGTASQGIDESFFLFFGSGIPNFEALDMSNTNYTGTKPVNGQIGGIDIARYDVVVTSVSNTFVSRIYSFNIVTYCPKYDQTRLAYMNRFGGWEYITLNKERNDELTVKKQYLTKSTISQVGATTNFTTGGNVAYPLSVAKQGQMALSVEADTSFVVFTDELQEDYQVKQIEDMMLSPQIHLIDDFGNAKALILQTSNMKLKRLKNRGLYQYELKFSFAIPKYSKTF